MAENGLKTNQGVNWAELDLVKLSRLGPSRTTKLSWLGLGHGLEHGHRQLAGWWATKNRQGKCMWTWANRPNGAGHMPIIGNADGGEARVDTGTIQQRRWRGRGLGWWPKKSSRWLVGKWPEIGETLPEVAIVATTRAGAGLKSSAVERRIDLGNRFNHRLFTHAGKCLKCGRSGGKNMVNKIMLSMATATTSVLVEGVGG